MSLSNEWSDRLRMFKNELKNHIYTPLEELPFFGFETMERLGIADASERERKSYPVGTPYGKKFGYIWLFATIIVPKTLDGKALVLDLQPGGESLLYVNGEPFGTNRADFVRYKHQHFCDLCLTDSATCGDRYDIAVECYAGHGERAIVTGPIADDKKFLESKAYKQTNIAITTYGAWCEEAYQLLIDINALIDIRNEENDNSLRKMRIDNALKAVTNTLQFEEDAKTMEQSFTAARDILKPLMMCVNGTTAPQMYMFGHSHLDLAWLWNMEETVRKCARTFSTQLRLMDKYCDYRFLQSQPWLYEQTMINYPTIYKKIQEKVKNGQWICEGGMYVEADTNMPSGESLVRQFLYGKAYFKCQFDVDSELLWLPDVFGYSAALPQIMVGCGIKYFSTQKIAHSYNDCDQFPYNNFQWVGNDGSKILSFIHEDYTAPVTAKAVIKRFANRKSKDNLDTFLYPFGYGDGGGGACRDHLEGVKRFHNLEGVPCCNIHSPTEFFQNLEKSPLPLDEYAGELYFSAHRGTYTSQAMVKKGNRACEMALREAEIWNVIAGERDGQLEVEKLYKMLLLNQFHDILPGSSIQDVYVKAVKEYEEIANRTQQLICKCMENDVADTITLCNALPCVREDVITLPEKWKNAKDKDGNLLVAEAINDTVRVAVSIPPFSTICLYKAMEAASPCTENPSPLLLQNALLSVKLNVFGEIISIYDKTCGKEFLSKCGNVFRMYQDIPRIFDAWDIDSMYAQNEIPIRKEVEILHTENGILQSSITISRTMHDSILQQTITLRGKLLTFCTTINWNERHKLLKVDFPFALQADNMYNETQYGYVPHPLHSTRQFDKDRFEVCNHKWSAICEGNLGAGILNDCKYGISGCGDTLSLTLLKSGKAPDFVQDVGMHTFNYAVYVWNDNFCNCDIVQKAYQLNAPIRIINGEKPLDSFVSADNHNIIIDTIKYAEDGNGIILRAYESRNCENTVHFACNFAIKKVLETNMIEQFKLPMNPIADGFTATFRPFEVKTFRIIK